MRVINLKNKLESFSEHWQPKVIAELNGQHVRLAKFQGTFEWHHHDHEDELFYVIAGQFEMRFRDRCETVNEGEMIVVPRGVEHCPHAEEEVHVMHFEPATTLNTGNVQSERTVDDLERL